MRLIHSGRMSTEQDGTPQTIEQQRAAIEKVAAEHGWEIETDLVTAAQVSVFLLCFYEDARSELSLRELEAISTVRNALDRYID